MKLNEIDTTSLSLPNGTPMLSADAERMFASQNGKTFRDAIEVRSGLDFFAKQTAVFEEQLQQPLSNITWFQDVTEKPIGLEHTGVLYRQVDGGFVGTQDFNGYPVITSNSTTLPTLQIEGTQKEEKIHLFGGEIGMNVQEIAQSRILPIDSTKTETLQRTYAESVDRWVYTGSEKLGAYGLINRPELFTKPSVTATGWATATADEIVADLSAAIEAAIFSGKDQIMPNKILLDSRKFPYIMVPSPSLPSTTVKDFIEQKYNVTIERRAYFANSGKALIYNSARENLSFGLFKIQRCTTQVKSITLITPYIWACSGVYFRRPESAIYLGGI